MQKIFFKVSCGVGMDDTSVHEFDCPSSEELDDFAYNLAVEWANMYGGFYYEEDLPEEEDDEYYNDRCFTDNDLDYSWEVYCPEKHDMYRCGGGSFMDDFKNA